MKLMKLGLFLKELRIKNNLTTKQVEVKTGISNSYISLIERDKRKPSVEILHKLAKAYKVTTEDLLRFMGYLPLIKTKYSFQQIPIYNISATKKPFLVSENIEGYSPLPPCLDSCTIKDFIAIRVKNKGMTCKRIEIGDILIIRKQSEVEK
jgi:transcriptional regulator with XRE-family HTH domain